jgi:hypothetical protein
MIPVFEAEYLNYGVIYWLLWHKCRQPAFPRRTRDKNVEDTLFGPNAKWEGEKA